MWSFLARPATIFRVAVPEWQCLAGYIIAITRILYAAIQSLLYIVTGR